MEIELKLLYGNNLAQFLQLVEKAKKELQEEKKSS
jgi:hypothetical protein